MCEFVSGSTGTNSTSPSDKSGSASASGGPNFKLVVHRLSYFIGRFSFSCTMKFIMAFVLASKIFFFA